MGFLRAFSSKKPVFVSTNNNLINNKWHMCLKLWRDLFPEFHGQKVLEYIYGPQFARARFSWLKRLWHNC